MIYRYSSILFDKVTLFAHDCNPNTVHKLIIRGKEEFCKGQDSIDSYTDTGIAIEVRASRPIRRGDSITIHYIVEQRAALMDIFYFNCTCSRCLQELCENELVEMKLENKKELV